jgi:hypothetical protein
MFKGLYSREILIAVFVCIAEKPPRQFICMPGLSMCLHNVKYDRLAPSFTWTPMRSRTLALEGDDSGGTTLYPFWTPQSRAIML